MPEFEKLLIIGPGLLGGSLGLAATNKRLAAHVAIWGRRAEPLLKTAAMGAADSTHTDLAEAASGADIVVFATPTRNFPDIAAAIMPHLPRSATITDVGSVKGTVCKNMEKIFPGRFIGSHPMAGAEKSGIAHARSDLFENAACIITPLDTTYPEAINAAHTLWASLGCRIFHMSPEEHDRAVASISHLPHIVAAALVNSTITIIPQEWKKIAGPGFRDTTRVASGPPQMWAEIIADNRDAICASIANFLSCLEKISSALRDDDIERLKKILASAKSLRDAIIQKDSSQ